MLNNDVFMREVATLLGNIEWKKDEPMAKHTSFRVGGPAQIMAFPKNCDELAKVLNASEILDCNKYILGAGTNILAPDDGLNGIVICLKDCLGGMRRIDETRIYVGGGVTMARAAVFAAGLGLSGLEFAHGIPGTVGGGVYMNAGAYGGEIGQVCECVELMSLDGRMSQKTCCQMGFSYRRSCLEESFQVVVGVIFNLTPKPEEEIRALMQDLMNRRKTSQPLDMPSAGSAFKRPVGGYAAALIDQAGLKGFAVGNAAISRKHAGFAVNLGGATAEEVRELLRQVADKVYENSGIHLEPEIRIW